MATIPMGYPTSMAYLESWLEEIFLRSPKYDKTKIGISALTQIELDRPSLSKLGLGKADQDSIYRSFFVYSRGIQDTIKSVGGEKLSGKLWDAFTFVLENAGSLRCEMVSNDIRREYTTKIIEVYENTQKAIDEMQAQILSLTKDCKEQNLSNYDLKSQLVEHDSIKEALKKTILSLEEQIKSLESERDKEGTLRLQLERAVQSKSEEIKYYANSSLSSAAQLKSLSEKVELETKKAEEIAKAYKISRDSSKAIEAEVIELRKNYNLKEAQAKDAMEESDRLRPVAKMLNEEIADLKMKLKSSEKSVVVLADINTLYLNAVVGAVRAIQVMDTWRASLDRTFATAFNDFNSSTGEQSSKLESQAREVSMILSGLLPVMQTTQESAESKDFSSLKISIDSMAKRLAKLEEKSAETSALSAALRQQQTKVVLEWKGHANQNLRELEALRPLTWRCGSLMSLSSVYSDVAVRQTAKIQQLVADNAEQCQQSKIYVKSIEKLAAKQSESTAKVNSLLAAINHLENHRQSLYEEIDATSASLQSTKDSLSACECERQELTKKSAHQTAQIKDLVASNELMTTKASDLEVSVKKGLQQLQEAKAHSDDVKVTLQSVLGLFASLEDELLLTQRVYESGRQLQRKALRATPDGVGPPAKLGSRLDGNVNFSSSFLTAEEVNQLKSVIRLSGQLQSSINDCLWFGDKVLEVQAKAEAFRVENTKLKVYFLREQNRKDLLFQELDKKANQDQEVARTLTAQREQREARLREAEGEMRSLKFHVEALVADKAAVEEKIALLTRKLEKSAESLENLSDRYNSTTEELAFYKEKFEVASSDCQQLLDDLDEASNKIAAAETEIAALKELLTAGSSSLLRNKSILSTASATSTSSGGKGQRRRSSVNANGNKTAAAVVNQSDPTATTNNVDVGVSKDKNQPHEGTSDNNLIDFMNSISSDATHRKGSAGFLPAIPASSVDTIPAGSSVDPQKPETLTAVAPDTPKRSGSTSIRASIMARQALGSNVEVLSFDDRASFRKLLESKMEEKLRVFTEAMTAMEKNNEALHERLLEAERKVGLFQQHEVLGLLLDLDSVDLDPGSLGVASMLAAYQHIEDVEGFDQISQLTTGELKADIVASIADRKHSMSSTMQVKPKLESMTGAASTLSSPVVVTTAQRTVVTSVAEDVGRGPSLVDFSRMKSWRDKRDLFLASRKNLFGDNNSLNNANAELNQDDDSSS